MFGPSGTIPKALAMVAILVLAGCASTRNTPQAPPTAAVPETKREIERRPAAKWFDYQGTTLYRAKEGDAYFFIANSMSIDADGAPNAYHPDDTGLDALANAGYPSAGGWRDVLATDPHNPNRPFIQRDGEFAGYFASKTALQDVTKKETDTARYVDARNVPYIVFPGAFYATKGTGELGDIGIAMNLDTHDSSAFLVAEVGPPDAPLGEVSICLAESLGGKNVNPRNGNGAPKGRILYLLFPHSKAERPWPLSNAAIKERADRLLESVGGWEAVLPRDGSQAAPPR